MCEYDADRTVENDEHYQKTTVSNEQASQPAMGDEEVMKKVGGPGGDILAGLADNVLGGGGR
ncbi:hypothetical protein OSTOST_08045, partial [Ostertagia ostertagi]